MVPLMTEPDGRGFFGSFGGRFVPEVLVPAVSELADVFARERRDPSFAAELAGLLRDFAGRPSALTEAKRYPSGSRGPALTLKREDLNHTGAHKINNTLGQVLLAMRMGRKRIIAETGAGQHGVAAATAAALFGLPCTVYMGEEDIRRQAPNVARMKLLGALVTPVTAGCGTLKDAVNQAMRDWVRNVGDTFYCLGSVVGPHPYPLMVRHFQTVIGKEARGQYLARHGRLPDILVACVGGGSNAAGFFHPFLADPVEMVGVEAGGDGGKHGASLGLGSPGIFHGSLSYILQDGDGQVTPAHSVSAGLDYPGSGPEHAHWREAGRVRYESVTDADALEAFRRFTKEEGIIPALESSHALAWVEKNAVRLEGKRVLLCLSGRGDKDLATVLTPG
jgi:tryptophan synthase beta chain